jgi:hypothetical protein
MVAPIVLTPNWKIKEVVQLLDILLLQKKELRKFAILLLPMAAPAGKE